MSAVCGVGKLGTTWMLIIQQTEEILEYAKITPCCTRGRAGEMSMLTYARINVIFRDIKVGSQAR